VNDYRFEERIGSGYYAEVFQVVHVPTGAVYAAKVYADEPAKREAAAREQEAFAALRHARLPTLRESFAQDGRIVVIMELVPGPNLRAIVEAEGPLPVERAVSVGIDVCEAFEHTSALGWTYRDLHPKNVHPRTPKGAMLVDLDGSRPPGWPGMPSGRIGYRAPELERSLDVTPTCDIYSLAGCLFFAVVGDDPPIVPGPLPLRDRRLADILDPCRHEDAARRPTAAELRRTLARHA
jgi:serine/threonine protein kinase